ncbi:uncharacterized protein TRUGW13939_03388 [Talaromyces rugulosus]|uniref:Uncharacterized protein n=1 Tax=Talaromyces rugulosus TaxID=121627 RepID=A0A7H8QQP3_TALRU|nr:uncharacterized protein TRUGW13939_03388 [Talaromyces rugulosus]QKX56287.1 hypothetical protein TRUGW13939_03388 [Talaromyces rugulosus]
MNISATAWAPTRRRRHGRRCRGLWKPTASRFDMTFALGVAKATESEDMAASFNHTSQATPVESSEIFKQKDQ